MSLPNDPVMEELYAVKEAMSAKYGDDLHALVEALRKSPTWVPATRPARPIRTAEARLRRLTDPGNEIRELRKIKERIAAQNGHDIQKTAAAAQKPAPDHPLPTNAKTRKLA